MYEKRTYIAGKTKAIHKTYGKRLGKSICRGNPVGPTPQAMANYNEKVAKRKIADVMNANFYQGDLNLALTYRRGSRPGPEQALRYIAAALRIVRREMKRQGQELVYMKATAIGERGGIHHHVVANCRDLNIWRMAWPHGGVHAEPLYTNGNYAPLAVYFLGQNREDGTAKVKILGNRWSGSRNLCRVEPVVENIAAFSWREPPTPEKGYLIDIDSIDAGENPVTGIPYLFYRMVQIPPKVVPWRLQELSNENGRMVRDAWAEKYVGCGIQKPLPKRGRKPAKPVPRQKKP